MWLSNLLSSMLTPVIGILAIFIAYQQYKVNRTLQQHHLFDRRYSIYKGLMTFIGDILVTGVVKDESRNAFIPHWLDSRFIFGKEIYDHMKNVHDTAVNLKCLTEEKNPANAAKIGELKKWFVDQLRTNPDTFSKYLEL